MTADSSDPRQMYLELLNRALLGVIYEDPPLSAPAVGGYKTEVYVAKFREMGRDLPSQAHSMIGLRRMRNLQVCIEQVLADGVPGDLIETGVWRGGATIFMRGVTHLYPKLSPGGFLIVDDFNLKSCWQAIHDYRDAHGIDEPIHDIDGCGACWQRRMSM